jgi:hypothetical protein
LDNGSAITDFTPQCKSSHGGDLDARAGLTKGASDATGLAKKFFKPAGFLLRVLRGIA